MIADSEILLRTYCNGYIKGDRFFFCKSRRGKSSLEIKLLIKQSRHNAERSYLSHLSYQTFYGGIKYDLLNVRGAQNEYHQDFQYLIVSIHYFHKVITLLQVLYLISCNQEFFSIFWWKNITIPLTIPIIKLQ